eukprot:110261_1
MSARHRSKNEVILIYIVILVLFSCAMMILFSMNLPVLNIEIHSKHIDDTNIIAKKYPDSWQKFNKQLLCSVDSNQHHINFLQYLYHKQFNLQCNDPSTKYLIYDISLQKGSGLGASLFGNLLRYFFISLKLDRVFLLHGQFDWSKDVPYCNTTNGMECYFLPLSTCDPTIILSTINKTNTQLYYEGSAPTDCIFHEQSLKKKSNLQTCEQRVIYINRKFRGYTATLGFMDRELMRDYQIHCIDFQAIISAFFLRVHSNIKNIIYDKIHKSLQKSLGENIKYVNGSEMMSLPIRASDKCKNIGNITQKRYAHGSEIQCFTPLEYVQLMNIIKYFSNGQVNTVILTSEDPSFVEMVINIMRHNNNSNVSAWNVIKNYEDYSVGEGTTTYKKTVRKFGNILDDKLRTSFYTDPIVSALSSLMLQLHLETEYMVYLDSSSWTKLMWRWLSILNCNINKQKHSMHDENKCILLQTPGYMHHGMTQKSILLSKDIQEKMYKIHMNEQSFLDTFGINVDSKTHPCETHSRFDPKF